MIKRRANSNYSRHSLQPQEHEKSLEDSLFLGDTSLELRKLNRLKERLWDLPFEMIKNTAVLPEFDIKKNGNHHKGNCSPDSSSSNTVSGFKTGLSQKQLLESTRGFTPRMRDSFQRIHSKQIILCEDSDPNHLNDYYDPQTERDTAAESRSFIGGKTLPISIFESREGLFKSPQTSIALSARDRSIDTSINDPFNSSFRINKRSLQRSIISYKSIQEPSPNKSNNQQEHLRTRRGSSSNNDLNNSVNHRLNKNRRNGIVDLRQIGSPSYLYLNPVSKEFLPSWLRQRPDFLRLFLQSQINRDLEIPLLFAKKPSERFSYETEILNKYLRRVNVFKDSNVQNELITLVSQKIAIQVASQGEIVQQRGSYVNGILILFSGVASCFEFTDLSIQKNFTYQLQKDTCINSNLAHSSNTQPTSIQIFAKTDCVFLTLSFTDLANLAEEYYQNQKQPFVHCLSVSSPFFSGLHRDTLESLAEHVKGTIYFQNEVVFSTGDTSEAMFFILEGKLQKQKTYFSRHANHWPEKTGITKKGTRVAIQKKIDTSYLTTGQFLGDMEMIYSVGRRADVKAVETSFILILQRNELMKVMKLEEVNALVKWRQSKPLKLIPQELQEEQGKDQSIRNIQDDIANLKMTAVRRLLSTKVTGNITEQSPKRKSKDIQGICL